jgi:mRNA interferase RelE/StbE
LVWRIELTASAVVQLSRLDKIEARRVTLFLRQRLATLDDPRATGKALSGPQLGI